MNDSANPSRAAVDHARVLDVHVIVTGQASHASDEALPGAYWFSVGLTRPVDAARLLEHEQDWVASRVLSVFHDGHAIERPGDFTIEVRYHDGTVLHQRVTDGRDPDLDPDDDLVDAVDTLGKLPTSLVEEMAQHPMERGG